MKNFLLWWNSIDLNGNPNRWGIYAVILGSCLGIFITVLITWLYFNTRG